MNHSTVSGCGEIEHSENSRKSGQQKNPTARKQLEISIKRTLKIGHCLCRFCAIQQRKKAAAISLPQLFGGSWWIRKPRSKKQSAGLFFAVCGRPTCSNPTSSSTKEAVAQGKNPSAAASLRLNASRSEKTLAIDPLISKKQITQTDPSE